MLRFYNKFYLKSLLVMKIVYFLYICICILLDVYIYFIEGIEDRIFVLLNYMFYICFDVYFDFGDF